jgi:hypothetical protein
METYDLKPYRLSLPTALGNAFFSEFNRASIQQSICSTIKEQTGYDLDPQNEGEVQSLMRVVYTDLVSNPNTNVRSQVSAMNAEVIKRATATISTGMLQQLVYLRDISENPVPLPIPVTTSTYGNKLPSNFKFGIF